MNKKLKLWLPIIVTVLIVIVVVLVWQRSNQRRELLDINSQQDIEQFVYEWTKNSENELAYRAPAIDVQNCEVDVLAVAEKSPYAVIYFIVTSTVPTDGIGYIKCLTVFEEVENSDLHSFIAEATSTSNEAFIDCGILTPQMTDWLYILAGDNSEAHANTYYFKYNGVDYTRSIQDDGVVLDINILPYGNSTTITDKYLMDKSGAIHRYS
mgnify:CR=1 FL=1